MGNVLEHEFKQLLDFKIENINAHLDNVDDETLISLLKQERGQIFTDAIQRNDLNDFETLLISGYADNIAIPLNEELRNSRQKRSEGYMHYEFLLNKALYKTEPKNDDTVYVMYEYDDRQKLMNWYEKRIECSVQFPNFLSSSLEKWEKNYICFLKIKTLNEGSVGKYIAPLTNKCEEKEV
ncbi:MAG: hypothetical protein ACI81T_004551, partial [Bacteroidia bacterium]